MSTDKEEKARAKAAKKAAKANKKRWYHTYADAYKIVAETYPRAKWAIWGSLLGMIVIGVIVGLVTKQVSWIIFGILMGVAIALVILTQLVKSASYKQIDGLPGAVGAVLSQIKRGWVISDEPARFNARTKDMVFRAIGRPGVVLVAEGSAAQMSRLVGEERQAIKRIAPSAPVTAIYTGNGEKQVPLKNLQSTLRKLPKLITNEEVSALAARFEAVGTNNLPIPKGVDPLKARPNRRAMRG